MLQIIPKESSLPDLTKYFWAEQAETATLLWLNQTWVNQLALDVLNKSLFPILATPSSCSLKDNQTHWQKAAINTQEWFKLDIIWSTCGPVTGIWDQAPEDRSGAILRGMTRSFEDFTDFGLDQGKRLFCATETHGYVIMSLCCIYKCFFTIPTSIFKIKTSSEPVSY